MRSSIKPVFFKLLLASITAALFSFPQPAAAAQGGWTPVIRPGVSAGTGSADYTVDLFAPLYQTDAMMVFFSPRFRINPGQDDDEVNAGLGYRRLILDGDWFVGANVYYDTMRSARENRYHQIGLGLEGRSKWLDLILNGYIPVGDTKNNVSGAGSGGAVSYRLGSTALLVSRGGLVVEEQLSGIDGEAGVLVPFISDFVETRAYAGGYYWFSDLGDDIAGVKARIEVTPMPLVTLNGSFTHDDASDSVWRGEAYLNIPFEASNIFKGKNPFERLGEYIKIGAGGRVAAARMTDRVERDRYIVTREKSTGGGGAFTPAHDMIYVDNSNETGTEDGSLEHPYSSLDDAEAAIASDGTADPPYVYIFEGAGAYSGDFDPNPLDLSGMDALIWGEHYALPGMTAGGYPLLSGGQMGINFDGVGGSSLVVQGLEITGTTGGGWGDAAVHGSNLSYAEVRDCYLHDNGGNAIDLSLNAASMAAVIEDSTASGNGGGFYVYAPDSGAGTTDITVAGNVLSDNDGFNMFLYPHKSHDGDVNVTISGNSADDSSYGTGIYLTTYHAGTGGINYIISGNYAEDNLGSYGIYADGIHHGTGDINISYTGNHTSDNENIGGEIVPVHHGSGNIMVDVTGNVSNNIPSDSGIYVNPYHNGTGSITLTMRNNVTNNSWYGLDISSSRSGAGSGDITIDISGNESTGNGRSLSLGAQNQGPASGDDVIISGSGNTFTIVVKNATSTNGTVTDTLAP